MGIGNTEGSMPPAKWPKRPTGFPNTPQEPIIGVNIGVSKAEPRVVNEKPEQFSIVDVPSAKVLEERKTELRNKGIKIEGKKLNLLDEGGIVDEASALRSEERKFLIVAYAGAVVDSSVRDDAGAVERQKELRHIISQVDELVRLRQEAKEKNLPAA